MSLYKFISFVLLLAIFFYSIEKSMYHETICTFRLNINDLVSNFNDTNQKNLNLDKEILKELEDMKNYLQD